MTYHERYRGGFNEGSDCLSSQFTGKDIFSRIELLVENDTTLLDIGQFQIGGSRNDTKGKVIAKGFSNTLKNGSFGRSRFGKVTKNNDTIGLGKAFGLAFRENSEGRKQLTRR